MERSGPIDAIAARIVAALEAIADAVSVEELAIPVIPNHGHNETARRLALVYALACARRSVDQLMGESGAPLWSRVRETALGGDSELEDVVARICGAQPLFSFADPTAGNWELGRRLAEALGRPDDFSIVAPTATWAIRVVQRTDHAVSTLCESGQANRRPARRASWLARLGGRGAAPLDGGPQTDRGN